MMVKFFRFVQMTLIGLAANGFGLGEVPPCTMLKFSMNKAYSAAFGYILKELI
jgi:hypothetical protein